MEEQPTPDDERELKPAEKVRLASLALRLGYGDDDVLPDLVDEVRRRLESEVKVDDAHALHRRKVASAERAQLAAESYLRGEGSLAAMCQTYQVTERTLSRAIARLRAKETTNHE
jgi:hypothetical protein